LTLCLGCARICLWKRRYIAAATAA
jgi:hypothetical protein